MSTEIKKPNLLKMACIYGALVGAVALGGFTKRAIDSYDLRTKVMVEDLSSRNVVSSLNDRLDNTQESKVNQENLLNKTNDVSENVSYSSPRLQLDDIVNGIAKNNSDYNVNIKPNVESDVALHTNYQKFPAELRKEIEKLDLSPEDKRNFNLALNNYQKSIQGSLINDKIENEMKSQNSNVQYFQNLARDALSDSNDRANSYIKLLKQNSDKNKILGISDEKNSRDLFKDYNHFLNEKISEDSLKSPRSVFRERTRTVRDGSGNILDQEKTSVEYSKTTRLEFLPSLNYGERK